MPDSQKTSRKTIVATAVELIEHDGTQALSMRAVARRLGIAPNALSDYFPDRRRLEAAVAAEGTRRLLAALRRAARGAADAEAVYRSCHAYLRFARRRPALYSMMMKKYPDLPALLAARAGLRDSLRALFASLEDPRQVQTAGFAVWALLHGMVVQDRHALLEDADLSASSLSAVWDLIAALSRTLTR